MENLPDDILSNIFVQLRAKQLAQMRCISKPWNSLLSQPSLVKSHLDRSVHNNDGILFIFFNLLCFDSKSFRVYPSRSPHMELTNFIKLPFDTQSIPFDIQYNHGCLTVIGSVNGLICLSYRSSDSESVVIYIWNPSLSAVLTLPPYSVSPRFDNWMTADLFRFGFDPQSDDYKVVKYTQGVKVTDKNYRYRKFLQIEVYSLRKGSWKLITQNIPSHFKWIYDHDHMYLDGHHPNLHWLGKTECGGKSILVIVAFNLGAETFREIHVPNCIRDDYPISNYLGVLGGKICVMSSVEDGECELWVMDEYGVPESWVKHHVFPRFGRGFKPYGFTLQNELIFRVESHGLALYDPVEDKINPFKFRDYYYRWECKVVEYVDSLVWVTPPKQRNSLTSLLKWFFNAFLGWFLAFFEEFILALFEEIEDS